MTPDDPTPESPIPESPIPPAPPPRSRRIMRWILWLGLGVASLLLLLGLLLTYWFPSNMVRQELEVRLSELLQGTVTIQSLSFNALTGLQAEVVAIITAGQPPITLDRLALDYSLWGLLTGTITINEVAIEHANISLNLPELTQSSSTDTTTSPPAETGSLPSFPVSIDLHSFAIADSHVHVIVSPDLEVSLSNINVLSAGALSSEHANLKGQLTIDQLNAEVQGKHVQFPLDLIFDTSVDLSTHHLDIEELTIISDPAVRFTLSGAVSEFFTEKNIQLSMTDTQFNLEALLGVVEELIPSEWNTATIQGSLSPSISINGTLPETLFQGIVQAKLEAKELHVHLPSQALKFGPMALNFQGQDIKVQNNEPTKATFLGNVTLENFAFQSYRLEDFDVTVDGEGHLSGPFSATLDVTGTTNIPSAVIGKSFTLPIDVSLDTSGNYLTRHAQVKNLSIHLGPYGDAQIKGALQPNPAPQQTMKASVDVRLSPKIEALLALVPKDRLQGFVLQKKSEPDSIVIKATSELHPDFRPERGNATVAVKLSSLQAQSEPHVVEGTMNQLTFLLASNYQEKNGAIQGTIGLSTNFSKLRAAGNMGIDAGQVILKSSFQGNLSPTYQLTNLRSHDQFQLTLNGLAYQDPSVTATLPSLRLSTETKEDLIKQYFILKNLRLTSDEILDMNAKGQFRQATQQFDVDLHMPLLHVGKLLPHLSGPLMKGIDEIQPNGRVSLDLRTAGKVPKTEDLKHLHLPLGLRGKLTLQNLEGAVAGYHIQGANGKLTLGYSPQATPQTQFTTDMTLNTIHLPETLPINELSDTALHVKMASPDFNEIQVDPIHLTSKGIDVSLNGSVVGLRGLLSSTTPRGTQLAKLFAELQTRIGLDIETFQEALHPLGITGTGKALVNLSVLKQEQGNLDATVKIDSKTVSLIREDTAVQAMNGGIQFRKSLAWKPDGLKPSTKTTFQPSNRIAQLRSLSRKGQTLTIEHLDLGPFSVQNFSTHLAFEQHTLKMQNLVMNLLGGGIGGNVIISAERPLRISTRFEIAHLDANQLITSQSKIQGDSNIDATIELAAILQDSTGAVDLSRLACNLQITHIGKEALERLLVFLDPEGSNPTLSNAKAQLKLANPSQVVVEVARGQLNLTIHFEGSLIPTFRLDRVPIAKMKSLETLTAAIPNWDTLNPLFDMIAADAYRFSEEGDLVLK